MNRTGWTLVLLFVGTAVPLRSPAADIGTNAPPSTEAAYAYTLEKRATDILNALQLKDSAAATNVHALIVGQYRALRDWHQANDFRLKTASPEQAHRLNDSLKVLHEKLVTGLSSQLTPSQVEMVKDKMTYDKVKVTYLAYCASHPQLTETQKAQVLELLKQAREEAMDAGGSDEKNKIFRKYKGRINNYLSGKPDSKEADKSLSNE